MVTTVVLGSIRWCRRSNASTTNIVGSAHHTTIAMSRQLQTTQKTISKAIIINHRIPATISYRLHTSICSRCAYARAIDFLHINEVVTSEYYCDQTTINMPDYSQGRCTASSVAILTRIPYYIHTTIT